jgi:hypothetical protein
MRDWARAVVENAAAASARAINGSVGRARFITTGDVGDAPYRGAAVVEGARTAALGHW